MREKRQTSGDARKTTRSRKKLNNTFNVVCFDFETTDWNANFGAVLCACVGSRKEGIRTYRQGHCSPDWIASSHNDRRVVELTLKALAEGDFWCAHNGAAFDVPFLYTRAAYWGLPVPQKRALVDPCVVSRRHFRLHSNSLAALADFFGLPPKTPLDGQDWTMAALARDEAAMRRIEAHCKRDVEVLCNLAPHFRGVWRHLGSTGNFY
jgi:uncharacterized protein YprB with RNaseH-like and TPR domain